MEIGLSSVKRGRRPVAVRVRAVVAVVTPRRWRT